jgi:hypothetical protein
MTGTTMWEVRAAEGALDALVAWVRAEVLGGEVAAVPGFMADVYVASDERVVVIATADGGAPRLPDPPAELVRRPAHQWRFRKLAA